MKQIMSQRIFALVRWVCLWALVCIQLSQFTFPVAAQEPTSEPTSLPTPTPMPTWTPTPTPVDTSDPAATPTATSSSPSVSRLVDFRVDDDKIDKGGCVVFSWVVRGDIDRIEFDKHGDEKVPVLVSAMDSRQECLDEEADYELIASWLDGARTTRSIGIEFNSSSDASNTNSGTGTPAGTAVFVPVTPIPITGTPAIAFQQATYQGAAGGVVVTPVGALGSVRVLPETGYMSPPSAPTVQAENHAAVQPRRGSWLALAGVLGLFLGFVAIGLALITRIFSKSEAPR